jgi:SAM-dependent methyltransferase
VNTSARHRAFYERLVDRATDPYRPAGRLPYHFARGKLRQDPVFFALLAQGLLPKAGQLTDLGCGQGSLIAILLAARSAQAAGQWPDDWPAPPAGLQLYGVDLRPAAVRYAKTAFGS